MERDNYLWLEEVESKDALDWVRKQNARVADELESLPDYGVIAEATRKILFATDRLAYVSFRNGHLYNFWQDEKNERGIWRRTTLAEYAKATPIWEVLLDLDQLAKEEGENWIWRSETPLAPDFALTMVSLSRGGGDAVVKREFDIESKAFVANGFYLPEAKSEFSWIDQDRAFICTDFGSRSLTKSGYSRQVRILNRGQKLEEAKLVYESLEEDLAGFAFTLGAPGERYKIVVRMIDFYNSETFVFDDQKGLTKIPMPNDAKLSETLGHLAIIKLKSAWITHQASFPADSIVTINLKALSDSPKLLYSSPERSSIETLSLTRSGLIVQILENVRVKILKLTLTDGAWTKTDFHIPHETDFHLASLSRYSNEIILNQEGFLTPPSIWHAEWNSELKAKKLKSLPARFDATKFETQQLESTSRDGEKIAYTVVRPKDLELDGRTPTLLYGYGGFEVSLTPSYLGTIGKVWLEKENAVYVVANIRGGGEFGPAWHQAALQKNRQFCYDDFISVAEDLIAHGVCSPKHLGIMGGSNGGLLVGAVMMQRPELFGAVVCQVPLLDMLRYTKLLAGHSWVAEYGDPEDPAMRDVILRYSPYQNVRADQKYPPVLFETSTKDDRVHPGHARKMAARLIENKQPVFFYENIEGGHGGAANIEQRIKLTALSWTFLKNRLAGAESK